MPRGTGRGVAWRRSEFRQHATAKPEFVEKFMNEWSSYLQTLQLQQQARPSCLSPFLLRVGLTKPSIPVCLFRWLFWWSSGHVFDSVCVCVCVCV